MACVLTIDLEDWFQSENVVHIVSRDRWDEQELTIEPAVERLLRDLRDHDVRATFFVLGWIAERIPEVVRAIYEAGHEIASHGYYHEKIYTIEPEYFRDDVTKAKAILEAIISDEVVGYRAPTFSITDWAIDILRDVGFRYDSSFFPLHMDYRYGRLDRYARFDCPYYEAVDGFWEYPLSGLSVGRYVIPWSGGGYFRLIPYPVYRWGVRFIMKSRDYFNFYIHPWEFVDELPPVDGLSPTLRFRHYNNIDKTPGRFLRLIEDFSFVPMRDLLDVSRA